MDQCRDAEHLIVDQTYEKELNDPSPSYTEQASGYQQQYTQPGGYQQGNGYGYIYTNVMATRPYSGNIRIGTPVRRPNLLVFSFIVSILCCFPVGIFAVCFAVQANKAADCGDYEASQRKAKVTKILIGISVVLGVLVAISFIAISSVYGFQ